MNAEAAGLSPKKLAATISRPSPATREIPVARAKIAVLTPSRRRRGRRQRHWAWWRRRSWSGRPRGRYSTARDRGRPPRLFSAMANIHSQKKRIERAARERLENRRYTSRDQDLLPPARAGRRRRRRRRRRDRAPRARADDRQGGQARRAAPQHRRPQEVPRRARAPRRLSSASVARRGAASPSLAMAWIARSAAVSSLCPPARRRARPARGRRSARPRPRSRSAPPRRASAIRRSAAREGIRSRRLIWATGSPASSAWAISWAPRTPLGHPVEQPGQPLALGPQSEVERDGGLRRPRPPGRRPATRPGARPTARVSASISSASSGPPPGRAERELLELAQQPLLALADVGDERAGGGRRRASRPSSAARAMTHFGSSQGLTLCSALMSPPALRDRLRAGARAPWCARPRGRRRRPWCPGGDVGQRGRAAAPAPCPSSARRRRR